MLGPDGWPVRGLDAADWPGVAAAASFGARLARLRRRLARAEAAAGEATEEGFALRALGPRGAELMITGLDAGAFACRPDLVRAGGSEPLGSRTVIRGIA